MHCSCVHKTSDGKRKHTGKRKPVAVRNARKRKKQLIKKLNARN